MEVSEWLHEELGFPVVHSAPKIEFVPNDRLADHRFRDVPADRTGANDTDVLAVYDDDTNTIFLPKAGTPIRQSAGRSSCTRQCIISRISRERCLPAPRRVKRRRSMRRSDG